MNHELICPQCKQSFRDEEFCPHHFMRLVPPDAPKSEETPADAATENAPEAPAEVAIENAAETGDTQEPESRLAQFMSRLGLRRVTDKATFPNDTPQPSQSAPESPQSPLPEAVLEKGWHITGPVQQGDDAVDRWPVERPADSGRVAGYFHRFFRPGALTTDAIYRRLEDRTTPQLARVWAHGTVDLNGGRADYELVSLPKAGIGLSLWLADSTPSEHRARHLLPMLVELLRQLGDAGVQPLTFDPGQLLLTDDGELWLATAAALVEVTAANEYRPEFQRSALLPHGWAAPELTQEGMANGNAAVFSLGQVLALAVWGQSCSPAELSTGAVPFRSLTDARLARVMMGCLWPRSSRRWTLEDLLRAASSASADVLPATPPWESLAPGASSTAFGFAGASFWRFEDLLAAAVQPPHWNEAIARLDAMLDWAEGTAWAGQVALARKALEAGRSPDWALIALNRAMQPDAPLTWRALDLSDDESARSLAALAQRVLHGGEADAEVMRQLFQADLRGAFGQTPPKS
jgi:hypothetical protein